MICSVASLEGKFAAERKVPHVKRLVLPAVHESPHVAIRAGKRRSLSMSQQVFRAFLAILLILTVFSMLSALKVWEAVSVFVTDGVGKKVVATL